MSKEQKMRPKIAVLGAGLIGRRHIEQIAKEAVLHSIIDPADGAKDLADTYECKWYPSLDDLMNDDQAVLPDGVVIATPTTMHVDNAMACVMKHIPVLIEKPIAENVLDGEKLVLKAQELNVPVLIGHHRRYNPIMQKAKELIEDGVIGEIVSINAVCWLYKPDDYYNIPWRRQKGAGPVLTNLIHDVDLMRYLAGEVVDVQAYLSNNIRGHDVEDSAAIVLKFDSGALGTMSVSDTIVSPWSWELTSGENPAYPKTGQSCYQIAGTKGSLSLPDLALWHYGANKSWWEPISNTISPVDSDNPLTLQIRHFCDVIKGTAEPLVSGNEGLKSLRVIDAILQC